MGIPSPKALPAETNERLRQLLRRMVSERFEGSITKTAGALGVTHATVSDVLSGKRGVGHKLLLGMSDALHRSVDDLLDRIPADSGRQSLRSHPQWEVAVDQLRARLVRRGAPPNDAIVAEVAEISIARPPANLTPDFLLRLYETMLLAREEDQ